MYKLIDIEGIGEKYAAQLKTLGLENQTQFLEACSHPKGRETLVEKTGISHKLILKWTNQADLSRIKGIAEEYSELLERSGVDSVPELAQRNAEHLYQKMREVNEQAKLVRHTPGLSQVEAWIAEAKTLPRMVHY